LSSVVYYLAKHPQYQEMARDEVDSVFAGQPVDILNVDMLNRMPLVTACVQEAMRMNNPSNFTLPRVSTVSKSLGQFMIPSHVSMCFNISANHHLESIWNNHQTFDPRRFTTSTQASRPLPTAFFGFGLRQCPARHFAVWELRAMLAHMLISYSWTLPECSVHRDRLRNMYSFGTNLNLPHDLYISFNVR
jgi:cytochrome P450